MKVAIAGAGMAGSYLYRLLKEEGVRADVYDIARPTRCGIHSCAWGATPSKEIVRLVGRFLEPEDYVLQRFDEITIGNVRIGSDMLTIDKPRLIGDLLDGAEVRLQPFDGDRYDRIIDATGVARSFLGPTVTPGLIAECAQYRVRTDEEMGLFLRISSLGYEWCFPLGNGEYHLGYGDIRGGVEGYRPSAEAAMARGTVRCRCHARIRLSSPQASLPFSAGKVVGVGESIGAVAPLAGEGITYAMQTGEMLAERWEDPEGYAREVLRRYEWMGRERRGLDRLAEGRMPTLAEARAFLKHTRMAGFDMRLGQAREFFRSMLETAPARGRGQQPS